MVLKFRINRPQLNEKLAEILGALNGDGHVSDLIHEVSVIVSAEHDSDYIQHLKIIFEEQFGIKFKISSQFNILKLRAYSKDLVNFLHREYNVPIGKKKGKLKIPDKIKGTEFIMPYLRGLFDTDGSIYVRRKKDPVIEIISRDSRFLEEVMQSLRNLGFTAGVSGKNLYIYRKPEIARFFNIIKPANNKHLKRYRTYYHLLRL